jgi:hypothetical protein
MNFRSATVADIPAIAQIKKDLLSISFILIVSNSFEENTKVLQVRLE